MAPSPQLFDRGWLSSTQLLLPAVAGETGAVLIDAAHALHAEQTLALVRQGLQGQTLRAVFNTHLHSDHCGGNAALQAAFGAEVWIPGGEAALARQWDPAAMSQGQTGQTLPRFAVDRSWQAGQAFVAAGVEWQLLPAPGHDPHALMLWCPAWRWLVAGDALWERGMGVIFPELDERPAFDDALAALDGIEHLQPRRVIPGHGGPIDAVPAALAQARARLHHWQADPRAHARHAARVLLKYHLMEVRAEPLAQSLAWAERTPLCRRLWQREGEGDFSAWVLGLIEALRARGALQLHDGLLRDA